MILNHELIIKYYFVVTEFLSVINCPNNPGSGSSNIDLNIVVTDSELFTLSSESKLGPGTGVKSGHLLKHLYSLIVNSRVTIITPNVNNIAIIK